MSDETVMPKKENRKTVVCIKTFGCQMNEFDSQVAGGVLEAAGYEIVDDGEPLTLPSPRRGEGKGEGGVDVVLMNTCSVREHAEDRVYSRLGMLGKAKKKNPNLIVGLMGCMVEEHKEKLFKRFPQLDLMVGTRNIKELPELIKQVTSHRSQVARIKQDGLSIEYTDLIKRVRAHGRAPLHAWLPIMTGCNKVCTFCIVPVTRGPEVSMPAREVYREASRLVAEGVKWITLLGQNVNSYNGNESTVDSPQSTVENRGLWTADRGLVSFPALLDTLCQIDGLERISFTTSHPSDATEELFQVIAKNPKISRRFHLPLQSGSDRILKRMKRLHTYAEYKAKINRMRELIPDVSVTTDIIAGFSGETEADYELTKQALKEIRYDGAYIYKYSLRTATPAAKLPDDVPHSEKERRMHELMKIQKQIEQENQRGWIGRTVEAFVDAKSSKDTSRLLGRTSQEKNVVFEGSGDLIGTFQKVKLRELYNETFRGEAAGDCHPER